MGEVLQGNPTTTQAETSELQRITTNLLRLQEQMGELCYIQKEMLDRYFGSEPTPEAPPDNHDKGGGLKCGIDKAIDNLDRVREMLTDQTRRLGKLVGRP